MIENPGPLADMQGNPASNFYGGRYNVEILAEDKIYYRGGNSDNALGQWFTTEPPESVAKVRIDTAVKRRRLKNSSLSRTKTNKIRIIGAVAEYYLKNHAATAFLCKI